jgi:hypothetical protein
VWKLVAQVISNQLVDMPSCVLMALGIRNEWGAGIRLVSNKKSFSHRLIAPGLAIAPAI